MALLPFCCYLSKYNFVAFYTNIKSNTVSGRQEMKTLNLSYIKMTCEFSF